MPGGARANSGRRSPVRTTQDTIGVPNAPTWLPPDAKRYYGTTAKTLTTAGVVTNIDATVLAMHAMAWYRWREAERALIGTGPVVRNATGVQAASPWVKVARDAYVECLRTSVELGMTPSSRGRVRTMASEGMSPIGLLITRQRNGADDCSWWDDPAALPPPLQTVADATSPQNCDISSQNCDISSQNCDISQIRAGAIPIPIPALPAIAGGAGMTRSRPKD